MSTIDRQSHASLEFELAWRSDVGKHHERYLAQNVNFWRDILVGELYQCMMGGKVRDCFRHTFSAGDIVSSFRPAQIFTLDSNRFERRLSDGRTVEPRYGRYYPKGLLKGVAGVYSDNLEPFRCIGMDDSELKIDFNHPLSTNELDVMVTVKEIKDNSGDRGGRLTDWMEEITKGPGMQARTNGRPTDFFSDDPFVRADEQRDAVFYEKPRLISHLDDQAREHIRKLYEQLLAPGSNVLDLMSSWQSHVPESLKIASLVGLGLNEEELRSNPQLTRHVVHDLNRDPKPPFKDNHFDAVICTASVEYLIRPFDVFQEVSRILKPGGYFIHTFSNRWFPPKAIRLWNQLTEFERMGLVAEYFMDSGAYENIMTQSTRGWPRPKTDKYFPHLLAADPVYAVWANKVGGQRQQGETSEKKN